MSMNEVGLTPATKKLLDNRKREPKDRAFNELIKCEEKKDSPVTIQSANG